MTGLGRSRETQNAKQIYCQRTPQPRQRRIFYSSPRFFSLLFFLMIAEKIKYRGWERTKGPLHDGKTFLRNREKNPENINLS
jgi:hypothetical protein